MYVHASGPSARGAVRITEDNTFNCGRRIPRLAPNRLGHRPAGEDNGVASDTPSFSDDAGDAADGAFDAAHGTMSENERSLALRGTRDGGRRALRFRAAVGGHIQAASIGAARSGHERAEFGASQDARADVVGSRHFDPSCETDFVRFVLAHVENAAFPKA